jgi:transcriptional regulator with XRE-family HTH domain
MNEGKKPKKEDKKKMAQNAVKYEEYYISGFPKDIVRQKFDLPLNERLKEVRNKRGYSLAQVVNMLKARGIETGRSTIQGYEAPESNGHHRYPPLHMLDHLCQLYNVDMNFIFGYSDEIERPNRDLLEVINNQEKIYWHGKEMSYAQKQMLIEQAEKIMAF